MYSKPGKATVLLGGQFGSEGKGAIAAFVALRSSFDIATTNAGAQSGHTSIVKGDKRIAYHLPTASIVDKDCAAYLNAGCVIDPDLFFKELIANNLAFDGTRYEVTVHPNAALISQRHRDAERDPKSDQTRIASTQKGIGAALADKIRRGADLVGQDSRFEMYARRIDLNHALQHRESVIVEVPQGFSLSLNAGEENFYPHCTSRDCTVGQALSDACIHPHFLGDVVLVLRTYPIRVGNIQENGETLGHSGSHYLDQQETTFEALGLEPEYTTVTGRKRRIFTWSDLQVADAIRVNRPTVIALTFLNYLTGLDEARSMVKRVINLYDLHGFDRPRFILQFGPNNEDIVISLDELEVMDKRGEIQWRRAG